MTYSQRILLRRLLPVVFWLLALGGSIGVPFLLETFNLQLPTFNSNYWWGFLSAGIVILAIIVAGHFDRHEPNVSRLFQIAGLLGIASYWLPTVLFLIVPFIIYAIWKSAMSFKAFLAILIAWATEAVYAVIFIYLGWIHNPWAHFFEPDFQWGWIPVAALSIALLASTIARLLLRER